MKIKRTLLQSRHVVGFPRPAASLVVQSGRLLEAIMDQIGSVYGIDSTNANMRTGPTLSDWALRLKLFNGLGQINITCDGLEATYSKLVNDDDLRVVVDVQSKLLTAISNHSPTLKYSSESVAGNVQYTVVDGAAARAAYFGRVEFPGKDARHRDLGFIARIRHVELDVLAQFELAPLWADPAQILFTFNAETSRLDPADFSVRAKIVNELVMNGLISFDLELIDG